MHTADDGLPPSGWDYTRGLKNLPPAAFLRTSVRCPVRILNLSTQNKTPPAGYAEGVFFWRSGWDSTRALKNSPPDCFCPACGRVVLFSSPPDLAAKQKHTNLPAGVLPFWRSGWDSTRGLKNLPPAGFLRTSVRRPVRILNLST